MIRSLDSGVSLSVQHSTASAVDLYAGAGGLSLGLELSGVAVKAAVETDRWAADTHSQNFPTAALFREPVSELPSRFFAQYRGVDIVSGGPPCQGFSISASHRRSSVDPRNEEAFRFVEAAIKLEPRLILFENVPQIVSYKVGELYLVDMLQSRLREAGYDVAHWVVDCADYGVPQHRRRFFLVASIGSLPDLPSAQTHSDPNSPSRLPPWLTVSDAIGDLAEVAPREVSEDAWIPYLGRADCTYQQSLRSRRGGCFNHVPMRHSPRLIERFAAIQPGRNGSAVWDEHPAAARSDPSQLGTKFAQNHRRLLWHAPSPTITAYMYSTCLHPTQHRNITVREAARLQSFPDEFRFLGKRTTLSTKLLLKKGLVDDIGLNQLNQVGNAVPPLMGKVLGQLLIDAIGGLRRVECA